mmetsp:Transcript_13931/g.20794  ORF Transcript_13931/g.20794 Transcript_13931/m.20794 type:complete len:247 (-) Transcript_13931:294-1034(-)
MIKQTSFRRVLLLKSFLLIRYMSFTTCTAALTSSSSSKKIFCFGDSLTAGTSPPLTTDFPYGVHLQDTLRSSYPMHETVLVRWKGYPGWTASALVQEGGLGGILDSIQASVGSPADLAVILAGTNDLAYEPNANDIFDSITQLHGIAHSKGVRTLALGIPPSAWQMQSSSARELAKEVNIKMESWADESKDESSSNAMTKFVPFPITAYDKDGEFWSPDGLHFSPQGYLYIGEQLAKEVTKFIESS